MANLRIYLTEINTQSIIDVTFLYHLQLELANND